ncbi:MAG: AAA family ATPase [Bacteroidota bacterium]
MHSLNTIFYGPPGTGKTYLTSQRAIQIIENLTDTELEKECTPGQRGHLKARFNEYQQQGKIALLTFHPSFAYEDFVEGIKPFKNEKNDLYYDVEDGIFKQICFNASYALYLAQQQRALDSLSSNSDQSDKAVPIRPFDALYFEFIDYLKRMMQEGSEEITFETKQGKAVNLVDINQHNTLAFQSTRSSKPSPVSKKNLSKLYRAFPSVGTIQHLSEDIGSVVGRGNTSVMWAAFNRLKAFEATRYRTYNSMLNNHRLSGNQVSQVQYQQMKRAIQQLDYSSLSPSDFQQAGNFVLIIDEINRGNPVSIFGELISLIEEDKRAGIEEALQTVLPYSREPFQIPPNLYIIGTMNTADQSVDTLDLAFRRRFTFQAIRPQPSMLTPAISVSVSKNDSERSKKLPQAAEPKVSYKKQKIHLDKLLQVLNDRLLWLKGEDYQFGHAYFLPILKASAPLVELRKAIYQQIIPLLEEYFFDDWDKRISVIGLSFVEEISGANLLYEEISPFIEAKKRYRWRELGDSEFVEAIQQIYQHD